MTRAHPILIHLHIPKNAGTTLSRAIKLRLLGASPINWMRQADILGHYAVHPWQNRLDAINALPAARRDRVRFFEAHCAFGVHERLPSPHRYLTVLREPVDRALSVYYHLREQGHIDANESLDDFISRDNPAGRVWPIDNAQTRYLAGAHGEIDDRPADACDQAMLDLATRRLRDDIHHMIVQDRFDEGVIIAAHELGWTNLSFATSNTTNRRRSVRETPQELIDRLTRLNELDAALYRTARELFSERAEAFVRDRGTPMSELLDRFRRRNAQHARLTRPIYAMIPRLQQRRERQNQRDHA